MTKNLKWNDVRRYRAKQDQQTDSCSSRQMTAQCYRPPLSRLPQNEGCSFPLSDAPLGAAEQARTSEHRAPILGGQPPPQIPFEFIHLCFPKRAHPHISAHNSDAFTSDTGVYRVTSRQYDMNQLLSYPSPIWCSWFRNSCSIPYLSVPSLWHGELQDTEIWHAVRRFFTGTQRLLSLLKTEISCVKTNKALLIQLQSVFFETSRLVLAFLRSSEPSHAVTMRMRPWGECGKPVLKVQPVVLLYGAKVMVETREQHCPLLPRQPSAEA